MIIASRKCMISCVLEPNALAPSSVDVMLFGDCVQRW